MRVEVTLMGGFAVRIDGVPLPPEAWHRRHAAALVKILALAPRARLHRDRVTDALWPDVDLETALPRLYKAAHYARQVLGVRDAIVVRNEVIALFPGATVAVDVTAFETAVEAARRANSAEAYHQAVALYGGELLPDDLNEPWSEEPRQRLQAQYEHLRQGSKPAADPTPEAVPQAGSRRYTAAELLERDDELALLSRVARTVARTGRGSVVLVTGEAGSGKSALTQAFLDRIAEDMVVAVGGCDDLLAPPSLAPFRDMADALPRLAEVLAGTSQPEQVLPTLLRLLATPTVLVLEDVHWADDATLDAIRYLSRRIVGVPAVLLLTFRVEDIDATHPLRRILGSLSGSSTRRLELAPLSVAAIRRLAGGGEAEAAEIHRVTKGNPFFVTEVLDAAGAGVPATVRDAVLARIGRLPAAARRLAERIAVVPSRTERWLADALAGDEPDALVQLERSGVLSGGSTHLSYRHELARQAIETALTVGELVQANREVLHVLLQQPGIEPARIVHHAVAALRTDLLLRYGPVAAAEAERDGAHRQAAQTLRLVLAHADELDPVEHARLLTQRAYSLYVVNEYDEALPCATVAVSTAERSRDPAVLADALMVLSRIVFFARGPMTARRAASRAVDILERLDDDARLAAALIELARTHSNLATIGIVAQPDPAIIGHVERALTLNERLRRDDLRAQALWYRGGGRLANGDPGGADDIDSAIALAAAETRLETRVRCYVNAAGSAYRAGRPHDARRYVTTGLQLAADGEFAAGEYRLHLTSAAVSASQGDWDHAIGELRDLLTGPGQPGMMGLLARSLLARLLARRGDPEAHTTLTEATDDPLWTEDSYIAGPVAVAQVELAWLAGTADPLPATVWHAMELAARSGHTASHAELRGYLRRSGHPVPVLGDLPGPWSDAVAGRWREAVAAWSALGEEYEAAVERARQTEDPRERDAGIAALTALGATATLARVRGQE